MKIFPQTTQTLGGGAGGDVKRLSVTSIISSLVFNERLGGLLGQIPKISKLYYNLFMSDDWLNNKLHWSKNV